MREVEEMGPVNGILGDQQPNFPGSTVCGQRQFRKDRWKTQAGDLGCLGSESWALATHTSLRDHGSALGLSRHPAPALITNFLAVASCIYGAPPGRRNGRRLGVHVI